MSSPYPPALLIEGRRLPGNVETQRRLVRALEVQPGERVLLLGAATGQTLRTLAREFAAQVTAMEWEPGLVSALEAKIREDALESRVAIRQLAEVAPLPPASFEVILIETLPPKGEVVEWVRTLRELLVENGRLGMMLPSSVGTSVAAPVERYWTAELGFPLTGPARLLAQLEKAGFEPLWAEALGEEVLTEYYRVLEEKLALLDPAHKEWGARQAEAIDLYRNQGGKRCLSYAMLAGRRREPGEKPPPARTNG